MTTTKRSFEANGVEAESSSKQVKMDYTDLITVLVGAEESRFIVHKDAICAKSPFFNAACGREWIEGQEKTVRLPEQDAGAFKVYLRWVYSDTLNMALMEEPPGYVVIPSFLNLTKAWLLSTYLQDDALCNKLIDLQLAKYQASGSGVVSKSTLDYVFEHTPGKVTLPGCSSTHWLQLQTPKDSRLVVKICHRQFFSIWQEGLREESRSGCPCCETGAIITSILKDRPDALEGH
ncbi:hypothetical protein LTR56_011995 [Elasticomyces elasticus]|nr:hypothetical protein LTR22_018094 [Elasticomyces elasticus]KAK3640199.1 hypothetical protein LTR56_011995 [Elasticomyces elasticus]KAK4913284.1 hypothetical protein LTR49_018357 [Elasticomyces elasticus]KAK5751366.1 hypothetical protein LTS12_018604 [Elasticomyces elasticus]